MSSKRTIRRVIGRTYSGKQRQPGPTRILWQRVPRAHPPPETGSSWTSAPSRQVFALQFGLPRWVSSATRTAGVIDGQTADDPPIYICGVFPMVPAGRPVAQGSKGLTVDFPRRVRAAIRSSPTGPAGSPPATAEETALVTATTAVRATTARSSGRPAAAPRARRSGLWGPLSLC